MGSNLTQAGVSGRYSSRPFVGVSPQMRCPSGGRALLSSALELCIVPSPSTTGDGAAPAAPKHAIGWMRVRHPSGLSLATPHPTSNGAYRMLPLEAHAAQPQLVRHPLSPLTPPHTAPAPCVRLVSPGGLQCLLLSAPIVVAVVTHVYGKTQVVTWLFKTDSGSKRANQE